MTIEITPTPKEQWHIIVHTTVWRRAVKGQKPNSWFETQDAITAHE